MLCGKFRGRNRAEWVIGRAAGRAPQDATARTGGEARICVAWARNGPVNVAVPALTIRSVSAPLHRRRPLGFEMTERDPPLAHVVRRQFERHLVAGEYSDVMLAHLAGRIRNQRVAVVQGDAEPRIVN
jgi:hypothetical protein